MWGQHVIKYYELAWHCVVQVHEVLSAGSINAIDV